MNTFSLSSGKKAIYPGLFIRLSICLIIAHFLVSFGENPNFFELLRLPYYYSALAGSFMITIVLSEFIYWMHLYLERYFSWRTKTKARILLQMVCGFISSTFLAVILAMIYFTLNHISIYAAGYFKYDFTVVICFIGLVNSYYVIVSLFDLKVLASRKNYSNAKLSLTEQVKRETPAVIFSEGKHNYVLQHDGHKFNWDKTIKESIAYLPLQDYFLVKRSIILHRGIISHYRPGESNTLKLFMHAPFAETNYYVSQRNAVAFKRWFEGGVRD